MESCYYEIDENLEILHVFFWCETILGVRPTVRQIVDVKHLCDHFVDVRSFLVGCED